MVQEPPSLYFVLPIHWGTVTVVAYLPLYEHVHTHSLLFGAEGQCCMAEAAINCKQPEAYP